MIITIQWADFHMRFLKTDSMVFATEDENCWYFYGNSGPFIVKSKVDKSEDKARNMAFVDRYLTSNLNIVKAQEIKEKLDVKFTLAPTEE